MAISLEHGYISADSHVVEPADLWLTRIDKRFRDRAPRVESDAKADYYVIEGLPPMPHSGMEGAMMEEKIAKGKIEKLMGRRHSQTRPGAWEPQARLADQKLDNIHAEVVYPGIFGLQFSLVPDPEYQWACMRVYNDWLSELCAAAPDHFLGAGLIPISGPVESAIAEAQRVARLAGMRSVLLPQAVPQRPYWSPEYEPLWTALEEIGLPVAIHTGTGVPLHDMYRQAKHAGHFLIKGNQMLECLADLLWSGVAHRHPTLRFVSVEAGMGWIASHLHIWDRHWKDHHEWIRPKLEELPSSYFHRQFWVSFEQDRAGILTRELLNVDHLMWGSDYPHCEGTFPQSRKMVAEIFAGVPEEQTRKMVRDNAARLYGIME